MASNRCGGGPRCRAASLAFRGPLVVQTNPRSPRPTRVISYRCRKLPILEAVSDLPTSTPLRPGGMRWAPRRQYRHDRVAPAIAIKA